MLEKKRIPKTHRNPYRKSIHLFDLDDTLIHTDATIGVRSSTNERVLSLTTAEFSTYRPKKSESFDFSEFSDLGILSRGVVIKYTKTIIDSILKQGTESEFGILTARGDKKLHALFLIRFFRSLFGIRLARENIFAVSDLKFSQYKDQNARGKGSDRGGIKGQVQKNEIELRKKFLSLSVAERKALVIAEDIIGAGFNDISFYDDSRENLESFKNLRLQFSDVVFKPHFIDPTWKIRLHEFHQSTLVRKLLIKGLVSIKIILEHHGMPNLNLIEALNILEEKGAINLEPMPITLIKESNKYYLCRSRNSVPNTGEVA